MEKDRIIRALKSVVNNPKLDLRTFEQSEEFNVLNSEELLSGHMGPACGGLPIIVDGDLEKIIISNKNEIDLIVFYSLVGRRKQYARVTYNSNLYVEFIRRELLPMTHIRLTANYTKNFGEYKGGDIRSYNKPLMYGHYICTDCGYDYGVSKECEGEYCCICEDEAIGRLKYVTDYYGINT